MKKYEPLSMQIVTLPADDIISTSLAKSDSNDCDAQDVYSYSRFLTL